MCVIIHVASIKSKHARQRRADLLLHMLKYCNFLDCRSKEGKSNFPKHRSSCRYHRKNKTTACSESVEIQMDVKVRAKQKTALCSTVDSIRWRKYFSCLELHGCAEVLRFKDNESKLAPASERTFLHRTKKTDVVFITESSHYIFVEFFGEFYAFFREQTVKRLQEKTGRRSGTK